jgi:hypothetical protein
MNLEALEQLEYNTGRTQLIIPENGRHFQKMIDSALDVSDRDERNKIANAIVSVMGNMHPHLRDVPDFQHKLWDQLFIMSDFKLDVDAPFPKPSKEVLSQKPEVLPYPELSEIPFLRKQHKTHDRYRCRLGRCRQTRGVGPGHCESHEEVLFELE